ncbi:MAG: hypothetical protein H0W86_07535 [Armatimonadetes bacterium]|nr:hypothetical protein [Armatimonadota bacterium]
MGKRKPAMMKTPSSGLKSAAIISFVLALPFAILEFLNQTITKENAFGVILLFGLFVALADGIHHHAHIDRAKRASRTADNGESDWPVAQSRFYGSRRNDVGRRIV